MVRESVLMSANDYQLVDVTSSRHFISSLYLFVADVALLTNGEKLIFQSDSGNSGYMFVF